MSEETQPEPRTESHDPAVPEAYAAFMRTGWGDRELDLPRHPVADLQVDTLDPTVDRHGDGVVAT